jgi:hypothetical protein
MMGSTPMDRKMFASKGIWLAGDGITEPPAIMSSAGAAKTDLAENILPAKAEMITL